MIDVLNHIMICVMKVNLLKPLDRYRLNRKVNESVDDSRVNITGDKGSRINIDNININSPSLSPTFPPH